MARPTQICPKCGNPARAAYVRGVRKPGTQGGLYRPIGRAYCTTCDELLPRTDA